MQVIRETWFLLQKEIKLEWRRKYAFNGLLLYLVSCIFVVYMAFHEMEPLTWVTIFWIILLFAALNAVAKSFIEENASQSLYLYSLTSPQAVILSKIIYNVCLLLFMAFLGLFFYTLILGNPVANFPIFLACIFLGALGFSLSFSLLAAIAAKASSNAALMPILSFPVIIPLLGMLIKVSKVAVLGVDDLQLWNNILAISAINVISLTLSYILFPYLWRD